MNKTTNKTAIFDIKCRMDTNEFWQCIKWTIWLIGGLSVQSYP